jgi:hypothetical protein
MIWHPARGTFWFVTLTVPMPQCGPQDDVFTHLFTLTATYPSLFQLDLAEWTMPPSYPCGNVGAVAQVLEIHRARIGSHPISHDLMRFTVQRTNGVVELRALFGEYLPPATAALDATLSSCPNLNQNLARQAVLNTPFTYSYFRLCAYMGSGTYAPDGMDTIQFQPTASWSWLEDPVLPRVLFTKSTPGTLTLGPGNYTRKLIQSDANCPVIGQQNIGFALTMDSVLNSVVSYRPGLSCIVCLQ